MPVVLKAPDEVSSASLQSPHDPDATYSARKGKGYEVQIAETCHPDNRVEVITHVEVTPACAGDGPATMPILENLAERDQRPQELVADTAYGSAENAVDAERLGTELVSPVGGPTVAVEAEDPARPLTRADFHVDVRGEDPAVCPGGHFSIGQTPHATHPYRLTLTFDRATCEACPWFPRCPARRQTGPEGYGLSVNLTAANLERRRRAEAGGQFRPRYRIRAGIEATNSELKRRHGLGAVRVRGQPRVSLAVYLKALACNVKRMVRASTPEPHPPGPVMA